MHYPIFDRETSIVDVSSHSHYRVSIHQHLIVSLSLLQHLTARSTPLPPPSKPNLMMLMVIIITQILMMTMMMSVSFSMSTLWMMHPPTIMMLMMHTISITMQQQLEPITSICCQINPRHPLPTTISISTPFPLSLCRQLTSTIIIDVFHAIGQPWSCRCPCNFHWCWSCLWAMTHRVHLRSPLFIYLFSPIPSEPRTGTIAHKIPIPSNVPSI